MRANVRWKCLPPLTSGEGRTLGASRSAVALTQMLSVILSTACAALSPQRGWAPKDTTQQSKSALDCAVVEAPCVVLVRPHLDVNIGAVARAMANFGLADLRLVAPFPGDENMERCDWRSEAALQRAHAHASFFACVCTALLRRHPCPGQTSDIPAVELCGHECSSVHD